MKKNAFNSPVAIFLNVCLISSVAAAIFMYVNKISIISGSGNMYITLVSVIPGLTAIGISAFNKAPLEKLGYRPQMKGHGRFYLLAWVSPAILAAAGGALYFIIYPGSFDPGMKLMTKTLVSQGVNPGNVSTLYILQLIGGLFIAPIVNLLSCGMEELGFRGFLLPAVKEKTSSTQSAVIISSLIWGIWYVPLAAIGYRYGAISVEESWKAMVFVVLFSLMSGCIISWLRLRTNSILPGVLFRSGINGFATAAAWFVAEPYNVFMGPVTWGVLGGLPLLLCGALCISFCEGNKASVPVVE